MFYYTSVFNFDLVNDRNRIDKKENIKDPEKRRIFTDNQREMGTHGMNQSSGRKGQLKRGVGGDPERWASTYLHGPNPLILCCF